MDSNDFKKSTEQILSGLDGIVSFTNSVLEHAKNNMDKLTPDQVKLLAEAMKSAKKPATDAAKAVAELNELIKKL